MATIRDLVFVFLITLLHSHSFAISFSIHCQYYCHYCMITLFIVIMCVRKD